MLRCRKPSLSLACAKSFLATSTMPEVSLSSRCTMPGRSGSPVSDSDCPRPSSAFTSVPCEFPAPACTIIPAGLLTAMTSSSSYSTSSGIASGSALGAARGSSSTSIVSPARTFCESFATFPFSRTRPCSINSCARVRESSGQFAVTARSSLCPASSAEMEIWRCAASFTLQSLA